MMKRGHLAALALTALVAVGCRRKHQPVAQVPRLPYPACAGDVTELASGHLRAGPNAVEQMVVERYTWSRRGCLRVMTVRQEWPLNVSDVEVIFDEALTPLRAWKRMTRPGVQRADGQADIRLYEFRTPEVTVTKRSADGVTRHEVMPGGRPAAVLGPGRGLLTAWIQRAHLAVGERTRDLVFDFRETVEVLRPITLRREPDMVHPDFHRRVRVYTVYGRETVFADERDAVIGDMAGMRPDALAGGHAPPPLPMYGAPDPVNTP